MSSAICFNLGQSKILLSGNGLILDPHPPDSPIDVTKCWCASRVFWFLRFLMSHTRIVLSSEALIINLPPAWNTRPLTQLSWPTCQ